LNHSRSVIVDAAKKDCDDSISCGYVSYGRSVAPTKKLTSVGGRSGKGWLIVDASTKLAPDDSGAPNDHIPPPGKPGRYEENPPVFYGSALKRHLFAVWNLRIAHPDEDLLQHTDNIDSAFRQMLYHPELAVVFAYVFQELLIVPVGNIFGSQNAPSWFTTPAEIGAHMANRLPLRSGRGSHHT
jgi:hypothetical protein